MMIKKTPFIAIFLFVVPLIFISCGNKSDATQNKETTPPVKQAAASQESTQKDPPAGNQASSTTPMDGQTASLEKFTFTVPNNWKGDKEALVWCPATEARTVPLPPVSLHCGGMPVMPGASVDDRIKNHIGTEPLQKKDVTLCGLKGFTCRWEFNGYKNLGLFLDEKVGSMSVVHFFKCRAPAASFDAHAETFKQIIGSIKCK